MAGNVDEELLAEARAAITSFSRNEACEDDVRTTLDVLSKSVNGKSLEMFKQAQISNLEAEIEGYEKQIEEIQTRRKELIDKKNKLKRKRTMQDIETETEKVKNQIESSISLIGIEIFQYTCSSKENSADAKRVTEHVMQGMCNSVEFRVEFFTEQDLGTSQMKTTDIDIALEYKVMMDGLEAALHKFTDRRYADYGASILDFFHLLYGYSYWLQHRTALFDHFYKKYPESVTVRLDKAEIPYLCIGSVFVVVWGFKVDLDTYNVKPDIHLKVEAAEELIRKDRKGTLRNAPQMFQKMIETVGIEQATEMIVQLVEEG